MSREKQIEVFKDETTGEWVKKDEATGEMLELTEKDKAITGMIDVLESANLPRMITNVDIAITFYEAGYRKQSEGEWRDADPNGHLYRFTCSLCGKTKLGKGTPYCPNCGAKMKGADDERERR